MKKTTLAILILLTLVALSGCSNKRSYVLDSMLGIPAAPKTIKYSIGIKTIDIPQYLLLKNIPFLVSQNQITYLEDKQWVAHLDEYLTKRMVSTLQKAFISPGITRYPYNSLTKPDVIIQITIHKFIADPQNVTLEASWQMSKGYDVMSRQFNTKVPIKSKDDIVKAMSKAFGDLENSIIQTLRQ